MLRPTGRVVDSAVAMGGAAFLAWAVARELDPDRPPSAALSAPVAAIVVAIHLSMGATVSLVAVYLMLVAARVLSRTTGRAPTQLDLALHVVVAAWAALRPVGWLAGLALAVAVVLDSRDGEPRWQVRMWWGAAIGIAATVVAGIDPEPVDLAAPVPAEWVPMAIGLIGAMILVRTEAVVTFADNGLGLETARIRAAVITVASAAAATAAFGGADGMASLSPVWVALAMAGGFRAASMRRR
jgi:hypothetical protein